jgi:hypothetical protein
MYYSYRCSQRREQSQRVHADHDNNNSPVGDVRSPWFVHIPPFKPVTETVTRFAWNRFSLDVAGITSPATIGQEMRNLLLVGLQHDPILEVAAAANQCGVAFLDANDSIIMKMSLSDQSHAVSKLFECAACCQPVIVYIGNCANLLPVNSLEEGRHSIVSEYRYYMGDLHRDRLHSNSTGVIVVGYTDIMTHVDAGVVSRCHKVSCV